MVSSEASRATRYQAPRRSAQLTSTWRRPHCIPGTAENTSGGLLASVIQATPVSARCFRDPRGAPSSCPPSSPRSRSGSWPPGPAGTANPAYRSEEHTSELQSHHDLVCRLLLEKKKNEDHL